MRAARRLAVSPEAEARVGTVAALGVVVSLCNGCGVAVTYSVTLPASRKELYAGQLSTAYQNMRMVRHRYTRKRSCVYYSMCILK